MSMFTLVICCLTTSNLPWFMDLTFQVPMKYCSLQHPILLPNQSHSQLGVVFALAPSLHLSEVISPLISSYILGTYKPEEFISKCPFCLFILFIGFSRQEYWSGLPFALQSTTFCQTSPPWPAHLGWPHMACLSFIELDKAVVHVIRLASCLWL